MSSLKSFPCFLNLPLELQRLVWSRAVHQEAASRSPKRYRFTINRSYFDEEIDEYTPHLETNGEHVPAPALLSVCSESRSIVQAEQVYLYISNAISKSRPGDRIKTRGAFVDLSRDMLYLEPATWFTEALGEAFNKAGKSASYTPELMTCFQCLTRVVIGWRYLRNHNLVRSRSLVSWIQYLPRVEEIIIVAHPIQSSEGGSEFLAFGLREFIPGSKRAEAAQRILDKMERQMREFVEAKATKRFNGMPVLKIMTFDLGDEACEMPENGVALRGVEIFFHGVTMEDTRR